MGKKRQKIDEIDEEILKLLAKRTRYSEKICLLKIAGQIPIKQSDRERKALLMRKKSASEKKLSPIFIETLFKAIFQESRRLQKLKRTSLTKKAKNDKL